MSATSTTGTQARPLTILAIGNGESTHVVTRTQWFAKRGHKVFLLTTTPRRSEIEGVVQLAIPADALASHPWLARIHAHSPQPLRGMLYHSFGVIHFLRALHIAQPDVIHVHYAHQYYGWIAGLLGSRPLVVTVMGSDVAPFEESVTPKTGWEWLTLLLLQRADYITPASEFLVSVVNRLGDFRTKTERVVWGVSLEKFRHSDASSLRSALGIPPRARVIFSPKILQSFYRVHLLVEAMPIVREAIPDVVLLLSSYAADPEYREQILRRTNELGLSEHVRFSGELADEDMPACYSMADVAVGIPPRDGMPVALFEGMACGTPTILSRLPRYEEIVRHEESAYFVEPDPEALAAGIIRVLDDAGLRMRMILEGRRIVAEQANLDEQAALVERRYRSLLVTTRPRRVRLSALFPAVRAAGLMYLKFRRSRRHA